MEKLTQEFLAESLEGLDRMERCLTALEARPDDIRLVAEIFRVVHTIKGTAAFLGYRRLERLAHAGEHVIGGLRSRALRIDRELVSSLLELMDSLRAAVRHCAEAGREDESASEERLTALLAKLGDAAGGIGLAGSSGPQVVASVDEGSRADSGVDRTVRVDVSVLNRMMNLVGELMLTKNQVVQTGMTPAGLAALSRRLDRVTGQLRDTVVEARLQPVRQLFGRFPRLVRDLSLQCGKSVRLELAGLDTGLDKTLLEAIKAPLTHALRNAVDHGIEPPERRTAAGKPAMGTIRLSARQQSGWVIVEVEDDGAGVSLDRVRMMAASRGLVPVDQAASMPRAEALRLLFLPGFSTSSEVTQVSGRGVGMDVVKENVERAGGSVELESREGMGTLLRLRIPLTLAILPALVVSAGDQRFCIPQSCLVELAHVKRRQASEAVLRVGERRMFESGGELVPAVSLDRLLGTSDGNRPQAAHGFYMVVMEFEGRRFALAVDEVSLSEEIVVKPLSFSMRDIELYSAATVLANGELAMILDVAALARLIGGEPATLDAGRFSHPAQGVDDLQHLEAA